MTEEKKKEMSFLDHLEELRWHIVRSLIAVGVCTVVAFISKRFIYHTLLLGPTRPDFPTYRFLCKLAQWVHYPELCITKLDFILQSRQLSAQFTMHITSSFMAGFIMAFPYVFWELWRFIKPALNLRERYFSKGAVFFVSVCFLTGVLFGYFVVSPLAINFLVNYKLDENIINMFDISSYVSFLITTVLACGITFQLPVVVYVLSKIGIMTPAFMKKFRKHAFVVILIVAAVITPSPDIFSQLLVAFPLIVLYEMSIIISRRIEKKKKKAEESLLSV